MSVINDLVNPPLIGRGNMRDTCAIAGRRALSHVYTPWCDRCVKVVWRPNRCPALWSRE